jgi:hypothetical protein
MKFLITPNRRRTSLLRDEWKMTGAWSVELENADGSRTLLVNDATSADEAADMALAKLGRDIEFARQIANGVEFD